MTSPPDSSCATHPVGSNRSLNYLTAEELDKIAVTFPALITRYDTDERCMYVSPSSERFTAKPASWFIGRPLSDHHNHPPEFLSAIRRSIQELLKSGESQIFETSVEKPWGVRRCVHHHCPEYGADGSIVSIMSFMFDITDRHASQIRLERTVQELSGFLAMLAHELRNPLVAMQSGLQALDRTPSPESAQRVREVMHREITHITRLIDDLLDTARVETGALKYRKQLCRLEECLTLACEIVRPVLANATQTLHVSTCDTSISLWADPNRIAQVVSNLLHNASKFSAPGSAIVLRVRIDSREVQIEVSDQGRGIHFEEHCSIFERYAKGCENPESPGSGIGLGLFVSREIAQAHSGKLELISSSPLGTTFRISLPVHDDQGIFEETTYSTSPTCAPTSILLVDDNTAGMETMKLLLELDGHVVYSANSALEGLLTFERHTPAVVILDLGLPDLCGRALAQQLRGMHTGTRHLLIALTGRGSESDARLSLEAGFDAHLIKPATVDQLSKLISQHIATME